MPLTDFVAHEPLSSYRDRFKEHFAFARSDDGVLELRMHTNNGEPLWGYEKHRALGQVIEAVAADRDNELLIMTGTGSNWLMEGEAASYKAVEDDFETWRRSSYELWYRDGKRVMESMTHLIDIPTIGVINGPGYHTELLLMCDLTICADDAVIFDPHLERGSVPGDGNFLVFQQLLGLKRANYAVMTGQRIDAAMALEWGLVNEVVPRDQLMPRAREIAAVVMQSSRVIRRVTAALTKRPWRRAITDDLDVHFAHVAYAAAVSPLPGRHERTGWRMNADSGRAQP